MHQTIQPANVTKLWETEYRVEVTKLSNRPSRNYSQKNQLRKQLPCIWKRPPPPSLSSVFFNNSVKSHLILLPVATMAKNLNAIS